MIVNDFNVVGMAVSPDETYAILIVDANAMLPLAVTTHRFNTIAREYF